MSDAKVPLWPVPLLIAATLVVAVHLAWWLSLRAGHVEPCIPYLQGCTTISRAARHGLGNQLFRLLVLPCASLIAIHWWLAGRWLALHGSGAGRWRAVVAAGLVAAIALAVYATFLGSEGEIYRFLRRNGVIVFFGAGYLAQVLFLYRLGLPDRIGRRILPAMRLICVAMLALGVVHVAALAAIGGSDLQDRLENALEWHLGVLLVGWFLLQAWLWYRSGYAIRLNLAG